MRSSPSVIAAPALACPAVNRLTERFAVEGIKTPVQLLTAARVGAGAR